MNFQDKLKIFHDTFIEYCLEEIKRHRKIASGINVPEIPTNSEKNIDLATRIPLIGTAANIIKIGNVAFNRYQNQVLTNKINTIFSSVNEVQLINFLSELICHIAYKSEPSLALMDDVQQISIFVTKIYNQMFSSIDNSNFNTLYELQAEMLKCAEADQKKDLSFAEESIVQSSKKLKTFHSTQLNPLEFRSKFFTQQVLEQKLNAITKSQDIYFNNIPRFTKNFVGRSSELALIKQFFSSSQSPVVVITGLGGIGKSRMALEYGIQHKEQYEHRIRWVSAENKDALNKAFTEFAEDLKININNKDGNEILRLVKKTLNSEIKTSLLIYDNVIDFELVQEYFPDSTGLKQHHIILTMQNTKDVLDSIPWSDKGYHVMQLNPFSNEESNLLLSQLLNQNEEDKAKAELATLMGNFPLSLSHSASYIKIHKITIQAYLKLYNEFKQDNPFAFPEELHSSKFDTHKENIFVTIALSLNKLSAQAIKILKLSSYLYPENIPLNLLDQVFKDSSDNGFVVSLLEGYSLILVADNKESFNIHRVLQEIIRIKFSDDALRTIKQGMKLIHKRLDLKQNQESSLLNGQLFLQHATSLIKYAGQLQQKDSKINKVLAVLYNDCGNVYFSLGKLREAKNQYELASQTHDSIQIIENLGSVFYALKEFDKSLELYKKALEMHEKINDAQDEKVISFIVKIASSLMSLHLYNEALIEYNKALEFYIRASNRQVTADIYYAIGKCYKELNQYDKTIDNFNKALSIYQELPDKTALHKVNYFDIGKVLKEIGKHDEALEKFNQALIINQKLFGNLDVTVGINLCYIGSTYKELNKNQEALESYLQALGIFRNFFHSEHIIIAKLSFTIGDLYGQNAQCNQAIAYYNQALDIYKANNQEECAEYINIKQQLSLFSDSLEREVEEESPQECKLRKQDSCSQYAENIVDLMGTIKKIEDSQSQPDSQHAQIWKLETRYNNPILNSHRFVSILKTFQSAGIDPNIIFSLSKDEERWLANEIDCIGIQKAIDKWTDYKVKYFALLKQAKYYLTTEETNHLAKLGENIEIAEQLILTLEAQEGNIENILAILFPSKTQKILNSIAQFKMIVGEKQLETHSGFYQHIDSAFKTKGAFSQKLINVIVDLYKILEEAYLNNIINDKVFSLQLQFSALLDFAGSGAINRIFPYFSSGHGWPDDYGSSGGDDLSEQNNNTPDKTMPLAYFVGVLANNDTIHNELS